MASGGLVDAARDGNFDRIKFLVDSGEHIDTRCPSNQSTALISAANRGFLDIVEYLVSKGATLNLLNDAGTTALDSAIGAHQQRIADFLKSRGGKSAHPLAAFAPENLHVIRKFAYVPWRVWFHIWHRRRLIGHSAWRLLVPLLDALLPDRLTHLIHGMSDPYFVQIGSHTGHSTNDPLHQMVHAMNLAGMAVEPMPHLYEQLRDAYAGSRVRCVNAAVSSAPGSLRLFSVDRSHLSGLPSWASQLASTRKWHISDHLPGVPIEEAVVECITPAMLLESKPAHRRVDILHVDTEGHDAAILGAWDFGACKPEVILFEVKHMDGTFRVGDTYEQIASKLISVGYSLQLASDEDTGEVSEPYR